MHHLWLIGACPGITSLIEFMILGCLSDISQVALAGPINRVLTIRKNHLQFGVVSFSTSANASGTRLFAASIPIAVNKVPPNLPVMNVPSTASTGRRCTKASTTYPNIHAALPNTRIATPIHIY